MANPEFSRVHESGSDDAIGESGSTSRRRFLHRSAAAAGAVALAASGGEAEAANSANVLPTLYTGWNARNFSSIRQHENDHVAFLLNALGGNGYNDPGFVNLLQPNAQAFANLSRVFENTGVAAYLGALPLLSNAQFQAAAGSIALIEARHAGYLNTLRDVPIANSIVPNTPPDESFEAPGNPVMIAEMIAPFLGQNAGLGLELAQAISTTPSAQNDVAILRFALALEYLERDFYNLNVPRFLHVMS